MLPCLKVPDSRLGEIINPNDPVISQKVDYLRKVSIHNPATNLFINKPVVLLDIASAKFLKSIAFDYLFWQGDSFFSNLSHGLFYFVDFIFLILGIAFGFVRNRKASIFLLVLLVISIIPHVLHGTSLNNFTPHITLFFPFAIIFIGVGIWEVVSFYKSRVYVIFASLFIVLIYLISLTNFLNIYFYQFPLGGYFNFPVRVVSKYIALQSQQKIKIYSPRSYDLFTKYLFYGDKLSEKTISSIRNSIKDKKYILGNAEFISCNNHWLAPNQKRQLFMILNVEHCQRKLTI